MGCGTHIPIIDLFAGPGGLGEGFSAFSTHGQNPFRIALSVEKDRFAWETLSLRCFYRQLASVAGSVPKEYYEHVTHPTAMSREQLFRLFPKEANAARAEAWHACLGDPQIEEELGLRITEATRDAHRWVLIGGPPCQAYSVAGRARNSRNKLFDEDPRHFLYKEYLQIIARHWPAVFVMENVTGILTSKPGGEQIFPQIQKDLMDPAEATGSPRCHRYRLCSLVAQKLPDALVPEDFVIRAEEYGIPQARHRVIILGIRDDVAEPSYLPPALHRAPHLTLVEDVLTLPHLRSSLSLNACLRDSWENWRYVLLTAQQSVWFWSVDRPVRERIIRTLNKLANRTYHLNRTASGVGRAPLYQPD
jgi:DNA (cytosine-5)-methyltransferase 1